MGVKSFESLLLNAKKTKFMLVSNRHNFLPNAKMCISNMPIDRVQSFKYLGITLTHNLSWSVHIDAITKRAKRLLGFLYRSFYKTNPNLIVHFYKTIVRPILEYNNFVWSPHLVNDIHKLESVQKFALRMTSREWSAPYEDLCIQFNLPTLATRRKNAMLIFCYKYINFINHVPLSIFPRKVRINPRLDHSLALYRFRVRTTRRLNFLTYAVIDIWNRLPQSVVDATSLLSFKTLIRRLTF